MNDTEKCREIAEWLEPMPTLPPYDILMDSCETSKSGAWKWDWNYSEGRSPEVAGGFWQPADFLRDESANALILEKIPAVELYNDPNAAGLNKPSWKCVCRWSKEGIGYSVRHADRKTAIVNAALQLIAAEKRKA